MKQQAMYRAHSIDLDRDTTIQSSDSLVFLLKAVRNLPRIRVTIFEVSDGGSYRVMRADEMLAYLPRKQVA